MPHPKDGYRLADGSKVPGVTTIIGRFKDSGGLLFWAFNQGKSGAPTLYGERDAAGDAGTFAHALVEAHLRDPASVATMSAPAGLPPETIERGLKGYENFLTWERQTRLKVIAQEESMVCECHRFGGTLDAVIQIEKKICIGDWKTSNGIYTDMLIQVAAYRHLWELAHPDQMIDGGFHLVRFSKEFGDFGHHYFDNLDTAWKQFVLFRQAYDNDSELKRRVK